MTLEHVRERCNMGELLKLCCKSVKPLGRMEVGTFQLLSVLLPSYKTHITKLIPTGPISIAYLSKMSLRVGQSIFRCVDILKNCGREF